MDQGRDNASVNVRNNHDRYIIGSIYISLKICKRALKTKFIIDIF